MKRRGLHALVGLGVDSQIERWNADSPLYGIISVFGVFAVRVEEDVLIYSSTEAEHVRCRMFTGL